jgi:purine-nucleoside phosphorylase
MSTQTTARHIAARAGPLRPKIAVILGSGWQSFVDRVEGAVAIPYRDLPGFPEIGVGGHAGTLVLGRVQGREVAVLAGRKHTYESGQGDGMKEAIAALAAFGVTTLVQTNAAGSLDPALRPGSLMLIADHINFAQFSPLLGERDNRRFVDLGNAYDPALREQARRSAGTALHEGVYAYVLGPHFETPAEIRMLRLLGADAVGMSTVPETILARHAGLKVLAISLVTNMGCGMEKEALSHEQTLAAARGAGDGAAAALAAIVTSLEV